MAKGYESYVEKVKTVMSEKQEKALLLIGELIEGKAKLLCPAGTTAGGTLRQSIGYKLYVDGQDVGVAVGSDIEYAIYVEKGTGIYAVDGNGRQTPWVYYNQATGGYVWTEGMKSQPYLEPAAMDNTSSIKKLVEDYLRELDDNRN